MNFSAANLRRRTLLLSGAASVLGAPALSHAAADTPENYPQRPVKVIIPYTAGSIGDLVMRPVLSQVGEKMGQPFVVDNKPGASQQIGAELAARAAPDGYTFAVAIPDSLVSVASLVPTAGYDARTDSDVFARDTCAVMSAAGVSATVLPRPLPTPPITRRFP